MVAEGAEVTDKLANFKMIRVLSTFEYVIILASNCTAEKTVPMYCFHSLKTIRKPLGQAKKLYTTFCHGLVSTSSTSVNRTKGAKPKAREMQFRVFV